MYLTSDRKHTRHLQVAFLLIACVGMTGCVSSDLNKPELSAVVEGANTDDQAISRAQDLLAQQRALGHQQPAQPTLYQPNQGHPSDNTTNQNADYELTADASEESANAAYLQQYDSQYQPSDTQVRSAPYLTETASSTDPDYSSPTEDASSLQNQQAFSAEFDMELEVEIDNTPILEGSTIAGSIGGKHDALRVLLRDSGGKTVIKQRGDEIVIDGELYSIAKTDASFVLLRSSSGDYVVIK